MLCVLTTIPLDPSRRDEATDHARALVEYSRSESGTVRYWAGGDLTEPNVLRFFEQYADAAAVEAHQSSDAYRRFVEALPELVDGKIETRQFETGEIHSVEFTAAEAVEILE